MKSRKKLDKNRTNLVFSLLVCRRNYALQYRRNSFSGKSGIINQLIRSILYRLLVYIAYRKQITKVLFVTTLTCVFLMKS